MKYLFTPLAIIAFLLFHTVLKAQPVFEWATVVGDTTGVFLRYVANNSKGDVYLAGSFQGVQDFDPGPSKHVVASPAVRNFILKLDANKNFVWVDTFSYNVSAMRFDEADNMYVLGFGGTQFVAVKRDANYNLVWSAEITSANYPHGYDIRTDHAGNVYVAGRYAGSVDFDPGPGTYQLQSPNHTGFILKLDGQGKFKWVKDFRASVCHAYSVQADDEGNVFFSGIFTDSIDFDPGLGKVMARHAQSYFAGYVVALDSNGSYKWAKVIAGSEHASVSDLFIDKDNNLVIAGTHIGSIDCDPGPGIYTLQSAGIDKCSYFVEKLTASGNMIWARQQGHTGSKNLLLDPGFVLDANGNAYISGAFSESSQMNFTTPAVYLNPVGETDFFVSRINSDGSFGWARSFGSGKGDGSSGMSITPGGDLLIAGRFSDTVDFDPDAAVYNLQGFPGPQGVLSAPFLLKLNQCPGPVTRDFVFECDSFDFAGTVYKLSGTYQKRFPTGGCDSISIVELEINSDIKVSVTGNTLTAHTNFGSCQWLDCDNGMLPIPGATGKAFTPVKTGRYAVVVSLVGCTDTSACYEVKGTEVKNIPFSGVACYPNPTTGIVNVDMDMQYGKVHAVITDLTGRVLSTHIAEDTNTMSLRIDGAKGLYFIHLSNEAGQEKVLKLIKE